MFDDRIEVVSPGGLPAGITAEEYLSGKLSILRNRNLANVFYRLGLVEIFGTGITRIKQLYAESLIKPEFEVSENAIKIVLPIFETNVNLTEDEKVIYKFLSKTMLKPIKMCIRDRQKGRCIIAASFLLIKNEASFNRMIRPCLLYTSGSKRGP